jgi:alpha-beta hydrolase superfamily lysophospholipase
MRVFYLHGFASSAQSSKASFFASRFAESGIELETPDLNEPDFSSLTITRMIDQICRSIGAPPGEHDNPAVLIGSSLGAFVALQAALRRPADIDRLVLLAPAFDFGVNRIRELGDLGLEEWRRTNRLNVYHYGYGRVMPVHYQLYTDARSYDCLNVQSPVPVQVFQGTRDTAVDPVMVEQWARRRSNVELHLLDDDHQLLGSLDDIWKEVIRFLRLTSRSLHTGRESPPDPR